MKIEKLLRPGWLLLIVAIGYLTYLGVKIPRAYFKAKTDVDRIRHIVASEELMLELNSQLGKLSRGVRNLQLPDHQSASLFHDQVEVTDVDEQVANTADLNINARVRSWSVRQPIQINASRLGFWQPLLRKVSFFDHARFYFIDGRFPDESFGEFVTKVGFKGLAKLKDGQWAGVKSKQEVRWVCSGSEPHRTWRIAGWKLKELQTIESPRLLFDETLAAALPDQNDLRRARDSEHEQAVRAYYRDGANVLPWRYFSPISANQRPGLSVVDVDQDGHDDLYVMVRRGRNQLLRNRGDGTFEEVARSWGLDVADYCSCGIFADFDNDGDPDLMLGRSIQPSMYLENTGRRFVQRQISDKQNALPYLVVSMSAADYNGDGLLDVYFSTYRPAVLESIISDESREFEARDEESKSSKNQDNQNAGAMEGIAKDSQRWPAEFLSPVQARGYERRVQMSRDGDEHFGRILDQVGPPNVLLVNRGNGRFEVAPESPKVALWRNTLQATWADFDEDGDPDIYVANDWATDNLLRNDGADGFVDVTKELGTTEFGFAMGVTWGDYDRDGRQDIYVSNMYSKAGRRITSQIAELNPSYGRSVEGNYLYRNTPRGFQLVSGLQPPALTVAEAGWSWGGQFADFDNDGFLDLYVLSGYFSAPPEFASDVDL